MAKREDFQELGMHSTNIISSTKKFDISPLPSTKAGNSIKRLDSPLFFCSKTCYEIVLLELSDVYGRCLYKQQINAKRGVNLHTINLENVASGIYFVTINDQHGHETIKLVKQ
jgi:hypothetical protein